MYCLLVCGGQQGQLCRQHKQNFPSNSLCERNLSVTACSQGAGDPETKTTPRLQPDYGGPCSMPGSTLGLCCASWKQVSPRTGSSDTCTVHKHRTALGPSCFSEHLFGDILMTEQG